MSQEVAGDAVAQLRERLARYGPDRHPLQHATAQFHLGGVLLAHGDLAGAEEAFTAAAALFGTRGARPEQAKALNGLGATLRADGRLPLAVRAFEHAAAGFATAGLRLEEGAALFNLGLVLRESAQPEAAVTSFTRALERLDARQVPGQAAAAGRELGALRLQLGDLDGAEAALGEALELADRVGDAPGRGAAANTLGLVRLAGGRAAAAAEAFATAVAANPRRVRPEAFAMAQANLALACERTGDVPRARLAARQALAMPGAPDPVRRQAAAVLQGVGEPEAADLRTLIETGGHERREQLVREELLRSVEAAAADRLEDARHWIAVHTASELAVSDVADLWLRGLLELPSEDLHRLVVATMVALREAEPEAAEDFRTGVKAAMARFHIPQWMRLQDVFATAADEAGDPGPWR